MGGKKSSQQRSAREGYGTLGSGAMQSGTRYQLFKEHSTFIFQCEGKKIQAGGFSETYKSTRRPIQKSVICEHKNVCCEQRILIISEYGGRKFIYFYRVVTRKNVYRSGDSNLYRTGVETSNWVHQTVESYVSFSVGFER